MRKTKHLILKKFDNIKIIPQIAIITGSGIKLFEDKRTAFSSNIKGHEHSLKLYKIKGKYILVFSGRHHLYEGLSITDVAANIRLIYELGIKKVLITNAAGGINKKFKVGDLMLITGFIDLMQPTERGILNGITQPPYGFKTKLSSQLYLKQGIYAGVLGPTYETYSEIKLLQSLGASAVGMSTVPEIICAKSLGLDFAAISVISNVWNKNHKPSHEEVLKNVKKANKKLEKLILDILKLYCLLIFSTGGFDLVL
ncbi:MAG: purine-nucleoside phosphorylase [Candidatus Melainabacteria bacterium]|nr:purine-nucleoside phosphorylase [Candidatus Melainabacteria bacterium]